MKTIESKEFQPLAELFNKMYNSDFNQVNDTLCKAVYMLHYVESGHFKEVEKQDVCFLLNKMKESFEEALHSQK